MRTAKQYCISMLFTPHSRTVTASSVHDKEHKEPLSSRQVDQLLWRQVEANCPSAVQSSNCTSEPPKVTAADYSFPVNLRMLGASSNLSSIYVAFDIVGTPQQGHPNGTLFGNWWSVRISNDGYNHQQHRVSKVNAGVGLDFSIGRSNTSGINTKNRLIELSGRVVDHWNGNYSVYFQVPIASLPEMEQVQQHQPKQQRPQQPQTKHKGLSPLQSRNPGSNHVFTLDLTLDYRSCEGYPDAFGPGMQLGTLRKYWGQLSLRALIHVGGAGLKSHIQYSRDAATDQENAILQRFTLPFNSTTGNTVGVTKAADLCDVGHYIGGVWVPPGKLFFDSKQGRREQHKRPQTNGHVVFVGDSTIRQVENCLFLRKYNCKDSKQRCEEIAVVERYCESLLASSSSPSSPSTMNMWQRFVDNDRNRRSPVTFVSYSHAAVSSMSLDSVLDRILSKLKRRTSDMWITDSDTMLLSQHSARLSNNKQALLQRAVAAQDPGPLHVVFVLNTGLHEMLRRTWPQQKHHLNSIFNKLLTILSQQNDKNTYSFVWRSTWSIHEYCFHPNDFWFPKHHAYIKMQLQQQQPGSNTAFSLVHMRDPTSYLQWSYTCDLYHNLTHHVRGSASGDFNSINNNTLSFKQQQGAGVGALYLTNEYWLTKSRMKRNGQLDTRHHDMYVVGEAVKNLLYILEDASQ